MKDEKIKQAWKAMGSTKSYSKEELEDTLRKKTKSMTDTFLYPVLFRILIIPIFCAILIIMLIDRWEDVFYRYNNLILCVFFLYLLYSSVISFYNIRFIGPNLPLKDWLGRWVKFKNKLEKSITGYFLLPFLIVSVFLSINLYYTKRSISDVISNTSNLIEILFILIVVILAMSAIVWISKRKSGKRLQYLEEYYNQLCD